MRDWIVVGGGFRGIISAHVLRNVGYDLALIERMPFLGGVHHSEQWNGFYLDKGCHLFSNDSDESTDILLDIMDDEVIPVEVRYASVTEGKKSEGLAIPDLSTLEPELQAKILYEIVQAATEETQQPSSLSEALCLRFGPTAAAYLDRAATKMFRVAPGDLDPAAFASTPFARVKVVGDAMADLLKKSPALDDRIAASSQHDPMKYYRDTGSKHDYRNFYPARNGLRDFCDKAYAHLRKIGVHIALERGVERIDADGEGLRVALSDGEELTTARLIWTLDSGLLARILFGENPLADLTYRVPMILYYLVLPADRVGDYTYVQDFTMDRLVFRASTPGVYSRQIKDDGSTFVCCEVTTTMDSPEWANPEAHSQQVWQEAERLGIVSGAAPSDGFIAKAPVSYKLQKIGFSEAYRDLRNQLSSHSDRLIVTDESLFGMKQIIDELKILASG